MGCKHCGAENVAVRCRQLCWRCYYKLDIREQYEPDKKLIVKGSGTENRASVLPATATPALPGSAEKLSVLAERALAGVSLWHPDDGPDIGDD